MKYLELIEGFNISCPECGHALKIDVDVNMKTDLREKTIRQNLSPLLRCTSDKCLATFRPEIILHRSIENIKVKVFIDPKTLR